MCFNKVYSIETHIKSSKINALKCPNKNLDFWNGRNICNGGVGYHKGLTKLRDGSYVLINGSDWQGTRDTAYVVSKEEALREILVSENTELLEIKRFSELKELLESTLIEEDDRDDELEQI